MAKIIGYSFTIGKNFCFSDTKLKYFDYVLQPSSLTLQFRCTTHCIMTIKLLYLYLYLRTSKTRHV